MMEQVVKDIVKNLMEQLYEAKGFNDLECNPLERNLFETEMQEVWDEFETYFELTPDERDEYEAQLEDLEERLARVENDNTDLIDRNYDLNEENGKLWERLKMISQVVNDTWC
jgi:chromosome segregation ATPase